MTACTSVVPARRVELAHAARGLAAVACVERHAARVGAEILARGGNAADATVAAAMVLAVTWQPAGNLGGGGVLVVHTPQGEVAALDFRETAPAAVRRDHFLSDDGNEDPTVRAHPALPVGVPGTPAGLAALHARFGSLPWSELVEPARALAAEGFVVDLELHEWLDAYRDELAARANTARVLLSDGAWAPPAGAKLVQAELADTLTRLRDHGGGAFYTGALADALASDLADVGGVLTVDDLAAYRAVWRRPVRVPLADGHELIGMPPPSSGGVFLGQVLGMLERLDADSLDAPPVVSRSANSRFAAHLFVAATQRAFAERARWMADPDQVSVPTGAMLAPSHLDALAADVNRWKATPSEGLGPPLSAPESDDTTQLSVVDERGMAISCTLTLEAAFGSRHLGARTGVLFNNQLNDFNRVPGLTDRAGRIGTSPNQAAPGKRPLTSMSPTIVLQHGRPKLIVGSPGGRTILSTVASLAWRVLRQPELSADELVRAPRLHHGWFPDVVVLEPNGHNEQVWSHLLSRGHKVRFGDSSAAPLQGTQGAAHLLLRHAGDETWQAAGDPRRDGWAAVVQAVGADADG